MTLEVSRSAVLKATPAEVWTAIGDFGAVGDWHPMLAHVDSDGSTPGFVRRATGEDGSTQVERLDDYDPAAHVYRYTIVETTLPVRDYHAEFRVDPNGDGSRVTWTARFEPTENADDAVAPVAGFIDAGVEALAARFG